MSNSEGIVQQDVASFIFCGRFQNYWRGRLVEVYYHPTDDSKVVTVGIPHDGSEAIVCVEDIALYAGRINNNDWSAYR
jgi:hypothetical protein